LSDLHIPYEFTELLDALKDNYGDKETTVVFNGDIIDAEGISSFPKTMDHTLLHEILRASEWIGEFSKVFKNVILLSGNHERRVDRLAKNDKVAQIMPFLNNILDVLQYEIKYDILSEKIVYGERYSNVYSYNSRFFRIGNVLFSHPQNFRKVPGATVRGTIETAVNMGIDFDIMVIGHTHQIQQISDYGKKGIETGCLTKNISYLTRAGKFSKKPDIGYGLLNFVNGFCEMYEAIDMSYSSFVKNRRGNL
jgi:predicted phosphodiesterase